MEKIEDIDIELVDGIKDPRINRIVGLKLRGFRGEEDYPNILAMVLGCAEVDGLDQAEKLEDIANQYNHLHHSDPFTDMLFAQVDGQCVGYCRSWWEVEGSGQWIGFQLGRVLPGWRKKGIGSSLLNFGEERLTQTATQLKDSGELDRNAPCVLDVYTSNSEVDRMNLLERRGYIPVRYGFDMVRPDLDNIPDLPLPEGVEVRPIDNRHLRTIWEASNEAFRDHWGFIPDPWEGWQQMIDGPDFDPSLWRVAWQGDQVAGMVLNFLNRDENEKYGRKRGYTENICVRRPWRHKGLAKALIAQSLRALKEHGLNEAALGVDSENLTGALDLYKFMGYQVVKSQAVYRKMIDV